MPFALLSFVTNVTLLLSRTGTTVFNRAEKETRMMAYMLLLGHFILLRLDWNIEAKMILPMVWSKARKKIVGCIF